MSRFYWFHLFSNSLNLQSLNTRLNIEDATGSAQREEEGQELESRRRSIFISLVFVTISASLLAIYPDPDDEGSPKVSPGKYINGFLCTVGASALYSFYLSLSELSIKKVLLRDTFDAVLDLQIWPSLVASCVCLVVLSVLGEWRTLSLECKGYRDGCVSYVMTLVGIGISWQVSSVGLLGLVFEVSSLFSNVISTVSLPLVPVLAVIFFHDRMDRVKVISFILAALGSLSYVYQLHLDAQQEKEEGEEEEEDQVASSLEEIKLIR